MCGIVGYTGHNEAAPILLDGLSKLEYRGYDSSGLAVCGREGGIEIVKAKGRLKVLEEMTNGGETLQGTCGIGHTRWATHGEPSGINAHPHRSDDENVVGVHNGIIENYLELRQKLQKNGYSFYSQTDTEVVIKLIDYYYRKYGLGPMDALARVMVRVRGSYALAVLFRECPEEIWVARKDSPLILGIGEGECFVASDVPAILKHTRKVYYIGNLEMARVGKGSVQFFDLDGEEVKRTCTEISWDALATERGGYEHFMMKEIQEQPQAFRDTLKTVLCGKKLDLSVLSLTEEKIKQISGITIVACGSAWHVGMTAQYVMEALAGIPVRVELASEFRYRKTVSNTKNLVLVISQSGETADSLAALRKAKESGLDILAIVNVVGSSIAREADHVFYTMAGPEIAVATTKAYSAQLAACYVLAVQFARVRGSIGEEAYRELIQELLVLPEKIEKVLENREHVQWLAEKYANAKDVFYIGRGIDYTICMEGSLKLKELSYIHSEAYAAGELKHGSISLIEEGSLVIGSLTQNGIYEKTLNNLIEVKSRGAYVCGLTSCGNYELEDTADFVLYVPKTSEYFAASLAVIPLQLLAYYVSVARGTDVDKPRNLAKSVTVE